jgi:hypothetical protein
MKFTIAFYLYEFMTDFQCVIQMISSIYYVYQQQNKYMTNKIDAWLPTRLLLEKKII